MEEKCAWEIIAEWGKDARVQAVSGKKPITKEIECAVPGCPVRIRMTAHPDGTFSEGDRLGCVKAFNRAS